LTLLTLGLVAISLRYGQPELLTTGGWPRWLYLACLSGMLGCVMLLGHYGAMLVFQGAGGKNLAGTPLPGTTADAWSRAIVTQAADAILAADASGIIRLWNHGAARIFGVPANVAIGQSLDLIIPETLRQRHWEGWGKVMRTGRVVTVKKCCAFPRSGAMAAVFLRNSQSSCLRTKRAGSPASRLFYGT